MLKSIPTLYNIGDCLIYRESDNSYAGFYVYRITKEEDSLYYGLLLSGAKFPTPPTIQEFKAAGFWGSRIPTYGTATTSIGPYVHAISEQKLRSITGNLHKIGTIYLDKSEKRLGSLGGFSTIEEILDYAQTYQKPRSTGNPLLDGPSPEILAFDELLLARSPEKEPEETWILSKRTAHPRAVALMQEDWLWEPAYEFSPLGNDAGADVLMLFRDWRIQNKISEPAQFIDVLEERWEAAFKQQKDELDYAKIKARYKTDILYTEIDEALIGLAFAQLVLEGKISAKVSAYAQKAVTRQKLLTENNDYGYSTEVRKERLSVLQTISEILLKAGKQ